MFGDPRKRVFSLHISAHAPPLSHHFLPIHATLSTKLLLNLHAYLHLTYTYTPPPLSHPSLYIPNVLTSLSTHAHSHLNLLSGFPSRIHRNGDGRCGIESELVCRGGAKQWIFPSQFIAAAASATSRSAFHSRSSVFLVMLCLVFCCWICFEILRVWFFMKMWIWIRILICFSNLYFLPTMWVELLVSGRFAIVVSDSKP